MRRIALRIRPVPGSLSLSRLLPQFIFSLAFICSRPFIFIIIVSIFISSPFINSMSNLIFICDWRWLPTLILYTMVARNHTSPIYTLHPDFCLAIIPHARTSIFLAIFILISLDIFESKLASAVSPKCINTPSISLSNKCLSTRYQT